MGDFLGRWFDLDGNFVDHEINNRVLATPVDLMKKVECKILV